MKKIATLGPKGTFSELAVYKYIEMTNEDLDIVYYPTIRKVFAAVGESCDLAIVPIENTIDGFVQTSLDMLSEMNIKIYDELILPIHFAFLGNVSKLEDLKKVYAQFKTKNQCLNFLEAQKDIDLIITESNGTTYEMIQRNIPGEGGIIPCHLLDENENNHQKFQVNHIEDVDNNQTRFIVLSQNPIDVRQKNRYKTSIVILDDSDRPGLLSNILNAFSKRGINLTSIISRPTKKELGDYYFFIDLEGHMLFDQKLEEAINELSADIKIKVLGSY